MPALNLSPVCAEAAVEKMLPSYSVLGDDEGSEDGFAIVWIHLKILVGEGARMPLKENESQILTERCAPSCGSAATI